MCILCAIICLKKVPLCMLQCTRILPKSGFLRETFETKKILVLLLLFVEGNDEIPHWQGSRVKWKNKGTLIYLLRYSRRVSMALLSKDERNHAVENIFYQEIKYISKKNIENVAFNLILFHWSWIFSWGTMMGIYAVCNKQTHVTCLIFKLIGCVCQLT